MQLQAQQALGKAIMGMQDQLTPQALPQTELGRHTLSMLILQKAAQHYPQPTVAGRISALMSDLGASAQDIKALQPYLPRREIDDLFVDRMASGNTGKKTGNTPSQGGEEEPDGKKPDEKKLGVWNSQDLPSKGIRQAFYFVVSTAAVAVGVPAWLVNTIDFMGGGLGSKVDDATRLAAKIKAAGHADDAAKIAQKLGKEGGEGLVNRLNPRNWLNPSSLADEATDAARALAKQQLPEEADKLVKFIPTPKAPPTSEDLQYIKNRLLTEIPGLDVGTLQWNPATGLIEGTVGPIKSWKDNLPGMQSQLTTQEVDEIKKVLGNYPQVKGWALKFTNSSPDNHPIRIGESTIEGSANTAIANGEKLASMPPKSYIRAELEKILPSDATEAKFKRYEAIVQAQTENGISIKQALENLTPKNSAGNSPLEPKLSSQLNNPKNSPIQANIGTQLTGNTSPKEGMRALPPAREVTIKGRQGFSPNTSLGGANAEVWAHGLIKQAGELWQNGTPSSFIRQKIYRARAELAYGKGVDTNTLSTYGGVARIGHSRINNPNDKATTLLTGKYSAVYEERARALTEQAMERGELPKFTTKIGGETVELTSILFNRLFHTPTTNVEKVLNEVDRLSDALIKQENSSKEEVMEQVANIAWLEWQTMPIERGNALASDLHFKSLALAKGVELPAWREGILPDGEALTLSREDFVKAFTSGSLFTQRP